MTPADLARRLFRDQCRPNDLSAYGETAAVAAMVPMIEALTPSGDTKAAYHGEFKFDVLFPSLDEDDDEPVPHPVMVPWETVKEIMAAISAPAALTPQPEEVA